MVLQPAPFKRPQKPAGEPFPHHFLLEQRALQGATSTSRESQTSFAQAGLVLSPHFLYGKKPRACRFWLDTWFREWLQTQHLPHPPSTFPSLPSLQLPELFCNHLHFLLSPAVGFPTRPRRDSDTVESVRHKLGELTDLHGLKRLVLAWA